MLHFVQVPDEQVNLAAVGEIGGDLLAEKDIRVVGDGATTVDPVVIGDGLERHARGVELAVKHLRLAVTLRDAQAAQDPLARAVREAGMKLEINAQHICRRWWVQIPA